MSFAIVAYLQRWKDIDNKIKIYKQLFMETTTVER